MKHIAKNRLVIIYLPNGREVKYCTKDLKDNTCQLADKIECEPNMVNIAFKEDKKVIGHSYVGIPYYLEMF